MRWEILKPQKITQQYLTTEFKMYSSASYVLHLTLAVTDLLLGEHIVEKGRVREPIQD